MPAAWLSAGTAHPSAGCASGAREDAFSPEDDAVLRQLAHMASVAVQNTLFAEEREANAFKDEFLATVSHELRTPLSAILTWARVLRDRSARRRRAGARPRGDRAQRARAGEARRRPARHVAHHDRQDASWMRDRWTCAPSSPMSSNPRADAGAGSRLCWQEPRFRAIVLRRCRGTGCSRCRQPADQRHEVHAAGGPDRRLHRRAGTGGRDPGARHGERHRPHVPAARVRPLPAGRRQQHPGTSGPGSRARHRAPARRAPWRFRACREPGLGQGGRVLGPYSEGTAVAARPDAPSSATPEQCRGRSADAGRHASPAGRGRAGGTRRWRCCSPGRRPGARDDHRARGAARARAVDPGRRGHRHRAAGRRRICSAADDPGAREPAAPCAKSPRSRSPRTCAPRTMRAASRRDLIRHLEKPVDATELVRTIAELRGAHAAPRMPAQLEAE